MIVTPEVPGDATAFRYILAIAHGCDIIALYRDDGELQCQGCGVDFARDRPDQILQKLRLRGERLVQQSQ